MDSLILLLVSFHGFRVGPPNKVPLQMVLFFAGSIKICGWPWVKIKYPQ